MKINKLTELVFAQAVALEQSGRMRSTIHALGDQIFIMNMDYTLLFKFKSPDKFEKSVSFFANDYESDTFTTSENSIVFSSSLNGLEREKKCSTPKLDFSKVVSIWDGYQIDKRFPLTLSKDILSLLEDGLSHVEFHKVDQILIVQKDIYSGNTITVRKDTSGAFDFNFNSEDFSGIFPIGIRTNDFKSLFYFSDEFTFYFQENKNYIYFETKNQAFCGFLATCVYDELPYINKVEGGK